MDPLSIFTLVASIVKEAFDIGAQIYQSATADANALAQRLQDSLASLRGQQTSAHAALSDRWAALQSELDAMKAKQAGSLPHTPTS